MATALIEHARDTEACANPAHQARWNAEYEAMTALGSVVAERMFLNEIEATGARNDVANAFRHVAETTSIPGEQAAYVAYLSSRVEYLLQRHRDFIEYVASTLRDSGGNANEIARANVGRFVRSD
ncbi:MAG: hypothetical protein JO324_03250 [Candidatus Eremiobacteraeota bacterium]|nr:hypothetical protein [Candidatus Eremiobacteraeota bacterium]